MNRGPASNVSPARRAFGGLGRWSLRASVAAAVAVATYGLGAIAAGPWLVDRALKRYAAAGPGRDARVERIRVNPFTLRIAVDGLALRDPPADIAFSAARIGVNFSAATLTARRPILDSLTVEQPNAQVPWSSIAPALERVASWRVERLEITAGEWQLGAGARSIVLRGITAAATGLDGRAAAEESMPLGAPYTIRVADFAGAELKLDGELAPGWLDARGRIAVSTLDLARAQAWLGPPFAALGLRGMLDFSADAVLAASVRPASVGLADVRAALRDLRVEPAPGFVPPPLSLEVTSGAMTWSSAAAPAPTLSIDLKGALADSASTEFAVELLAAGDRTEALTLEIVDAPAAILAPYAERALGRGLAAGRVDFELDYASGGANAAGELRLAAAGLELAPAAADGEAASDELPLELVAALLEDSRGEIALTVPLTAALRANANVAAALGDALRTRVAAIGSAPFATLGAVVGRDGDSLRTVRFAPGAAALSGPELAKVRALADGLRQRPALGVRVLGGFDATVDRAALANQQIELHVLLATAGPSPQARPEPVDFASPRAQDVLDEFAGERLAPGRVAALAARFGLDRAGEADRAARTAYYAAVFDALVANEPIEPAALTRLGRFRAQAVAGALADAGIAAPRIEVDLGPAAARASGVEIPISLHASTRAP